MASQYRSVSILKGGSSQSVAENQTAQVVSEPAALLPQVQRGGLRIDAKVSTSTIAVGANLRLQHSNSLDATNANWADVSATLTQVSVTTGASNAYFSIVLNPNDSTDSPVFPLRPFVRLVANTGAGDSFTLTEIYLVREE